MCLQVTNIHLVIIFAAINFGLQKVEVTATIIVTIWGGVLPPSAEASIGPNAQLHTN